jgi:regulator of replication initiation timing
MEELKDIQIEVLKRNNDFYFSQLKKQIEINHTLAMENARLKALVKILSRKNYDTPQHFTLR